MPKNIYRRVENEHTKDTQSLQSQMFDMLSGAQKGIDMGPALSILGELNSAAVHVGIGAQLRVFNNSASVAWVAFGDSSLAAPTGGSDGIAIPPNSYVFVCSGEDDHVRASAATVFGYKASDDTTLRLEKVE
jgi:hypothetical protein